MKLSASCWALVFLGWMPLDAFQVDDIDVHGAFSQSYLKSHGHEWLIPGSLEGTFAYTEATLNAHKQFEHWNLGAQVISRDFGEEGDFELRLDWGHVEINPMDALSFRLGRVKLPIGLYAEYRDVDMARNEILMPQTFIPEDYRAAAVAYDGAGVAGDLPLGETHLFQYHLFWGTNDIKDDFFLNAVTQRTYENATTFPANAFGAGSPAVPGINQGGSVLDTKSLRGGQLVWTYDPWRWRLGYNYIHYIGHYLVRIYDLKNYGGAGQPNVLMDRHGLELDIQWHVLSTDVHVGEWFLRAETLLRRNDYTHGDVFMEHFSRPAGNSNPQANGDDLWSWYVSAERQITERTGAYARFGRMILTEQRPAVGGSTKLSEFSAGVRYDFNEHMLGKLQVFHYWDYRGTLDESTNQDGSWGMILGRVTIHF